MYQLICILLIYVHHLSSNCNTISHTVCLYSMQLCALCISINMRMMVSFIGIWQLLYIGECAGVSKGEFRYSTI